MKILSKSHDGGNTSGVTGYWLLEFKNLFSIVILKFNPNNRENFHSHAFNAYTFWLKGEVLEEQFNGKLKKYKGFSFIPKYTPKNNIHKIHTKETSWALSFRGPWERYWTEYNKNNNEATVLTYGRVPVKVLKLKDKN